MSEQGRYADQLTSSVGTRVRRRAGRFLARTGVASLALLSGGVMADQSERAEAATPAYRSTAIGECPQMLGGTALSAMQLSANPSGGDVIAAGFAGFTGNEMCVNESNTARFFVTNVGNETVTSLRVNLTGYPNIRVDEVTGPTIAAPLCIRPSYAPNDMNCEVIDDQFTPGESHEVNVRFNTGAKPMAGQMVHAFFGSTNLSEQFVTNNMVEAPVDVLAPKTALATPRSVYVQPLHTIPTGRYCRLSTVELATQKGLEDAHKFRAIVRSGQNITFIRGRKPQRGISKEVLGNDRNDKVYATMRACTTGKRAVSSLVSIDGTNADERRFRVTFTPVSKSVTFRPVN